ncbi:hypothetical protein V6S67_03610 [Arthrobacter sp. Soc17.1.1.1]|uniref:hypothetical protein n=1 Tax=Arthrobacter sp. Soc17.1.1.1 TaxID=3121277 RepID=UPI002FE43C79
MQTTQNSTAEWRALNHLVISTIRAARERSVLTRSALAHPTLAQTVLWADTVSRSHDKTAQPRPWLRNAARDAAKEAYESLPGSSALSAAPDWYSRLSNNEVEIVQPGEWNLFLQSVCAESINTAVHPEHLDRWSKELAIGLIEDQRSINGLHQRMKEIISQKKVSLLSAQSQIEKLLTPATVEHIVAVGILGASELIDFETLIVDKSVTLLSDASREVGFELWGKAGERVADFVRTASRQRLLFANRDHLIGPRIFLQVLVTASDSESAGNKALRIVQRILDAYHAAHPTALLSLYSLVGTAERQSKKNSFALLDRDERKGDSINLVGFQPIEKLTSTLRVNSMIRTAPATVTRASFSWVALDAAGIEKDDIDACGKALTLLELRQLFFISYRDFIRYSAASTRTHNDQVRLAETLKKRARRLRRHGAAGQLADQLNLSSLHLDAAALFHKRLSVLCKNQADRTRFLLNQVQVSEGSVTYGNSSFATLGDFSAWSMTLRESKTNSNSTKGAAFSEIAAEIFHEYTTELRVLTDLAVHPHLLKNRLEHRTKYFSAQLKSLYSARNMHLHNGVHDVAGEVGLAQLGQSLVDAMLEIWSIWLASSTTMRPIDVVNDLASRFDLVVAETSSGRLLEDLNPGMIAAPNWVLP